MRKYLVILLVLFTSVSFAQNWNTITQGSKYTYTKFLGGIKADSGLIVPTYSILTNHFKDSVGSIGRFNDSLYFRSSTGWVNIGRQTASSGNYLPLILTSSQRIRGNFYDLTIDSVDNFIVQNSNAINMYGSNSSSLRSGGLTLVEGETVDLTANDVTINSVNGLKLFNSNSAVYNAITTQGSLWKIQFNDNSKEFTLDGTNLGGNTMTLPASDGTPIYRINGQSCDIAGDIVVDSSNITDLHSEAYYNTKYAAISVNGTVTNVSRTNGVGIIASVTNATTTPNISIAVDTASSSILSRQRAAATYQPITTRKAIDSISKAYTSTITFAGTAPSGTTNHSYEWSQNGRVVTFRISTFFTVAGSGNTSVSFAVPSDMPTPALVTGYQVSSDDKMYILSCNGGNTRTIANPLSCWVAYNGGPPIFKVYAASQNLQYITITGSYFTNN